MIPAVQSHPPVVPNNHRNLFATGQCDRRVHDRRQHLQAANSPSSLSFPIRTVQPYSTSLLGASSFSNGQSHEYQLRRKTPNGTINAGYDGSPPKYAMAGPPFKQVAVSVYSASGAQYQGHHTQRQFNREPVCVDHGNDPAASANAWSADILTQPTSFANFNISAHASQPYESTQERNYTYGGAFQPVIRANEYNVRAFCPPPTALVGGLPFDQYSWQNAMPIWQNQPARTHTVFPTLQNQQSSFQPGVGPDFQATSGPLTTMGNTKLQYPPRVGREIQPAFTSKNSFYNTQPDFKEKALSQAYRCYADLVGQVQGSKKTGFNKGTVSTEIAASKHLIFPKPPRPRRENCVSQVHQGNGSVNLGNTSLHPKVPMAGECILTRRHEHGFGQNQAQPSSPLYAGVDQFRALHTAPSTHSIALADKLHFSSPAASPITDARTSIELLKSLCEQSQWAWIDGALILGCLHYALEEYSNSLQCFSRVISLDPSHVEAIANTAAALYCLERHDEAERRWLRALQLRPSYLEAAEHLVGLLYKKRSREAIEVISFIQRSLTATAAMKDAAQASCIGQTNAVDRKVTDEVAFRQGLRGAAIAHPSDAAAQAAQTAGHGSSGYLLPGSENGRILALVHAKGTMLYGLKDVDGAARAFEEGVLISVGRNISGVRELVQRIQTSLTQAGALISLESGRGNAMLPLFLTPDKARHTARLVFGGNGELPGLRLVTDPGPKRAAIQTTSNSLLSLAKIFQDSMSGAGGTPSSALMRPSSGIGDILALYYLSLSLQESPSTANNVGILLAGIPQATSTANTLSSSMLAHPIVPGITPGSGLSLALAYYNYGLRLDSKHVHLHTNLGSLLKDVGQLDLAIQMYERAVACDGTFDIALTNLANAVKDKGRLTEAISYYRRAVAANPGFAEAVCGLFTALNSVCDWRGRGGMYLYSGTYDRWHVDEKGLLADATASCCSSGLAKRVVDIVCQQLEDASQWGHHVFDRALAGEFTRQFQYLCEDSSFDLAAQLGNWIGSRWVGSRIVRLVERAGKVALRKWYLDLYVRNGSKARDLRYIRPRLPPSLSVPLAPTVLPFHTFTCPLTAREVRTISQQNAIRISCSTLRSPWLPETLVSPPLPPDPHLNVGYVSSDFNNHPLAHLMQSVFGFHDRKRVQAFCYATTPSDKSTFRQKIENEAPVFRHVSSWSPERLIKQIHDDNIHILVNLNGYTRGARNEIFAARPAPIQMSFMGFAGTLGAEWCDYILADTTAIPPTTLRPYRQNQSLEDIFRDQSEDDNGEWIYTENIIFCKDTFFCCDHAQSAVASERFMTWEDEQHRRATMRKDLFPKLPKETVILANFNQLYKIEPSIFRSWLRILSKVPNAILWLLRFPESGESNLRKTAELWAGAEVASRIIFTDVAQKNQHISRARICDLFLDTPECNAHTTAADVLWSSTPLLTFPRYPYKMCSRMAASILRGALPQSHEGSKISQELVANSEAEYELFATRLASGLKYSAVDGDLTAKGRLADIRRVLWDNKWTCGLFDTRRWVRDVEGAYEEAWCRWESGRGGDIYL